MQFGWIGNHNNINKLNCFDSQSSYRQMTVLGPLEQWNIFGLTNKLSSDEKLI